jgi:hypothetical protein
MFAQIFERKGEAIPGQPAFQANQPPLGDARVKNRTSRMGQESGRTSPNGCLQISDQASQ